MRRRAAVVLATVVLAALGVEAHKPVTSKYTYTEDVYPIVSQRCGGCHMAGGIAPMSLLTYDEARPWAESIRAELTSAHMPPWFGDPSVAELKDPHKLSPRELDVLLTWTTGGTPRGPALATAEAPSKGVATGWRRGRPDVSVAMPAAVTVEPDKTEATRDFDLEAATDHDRWVRAADVRPGNAAIVHDAIVYTKASGRNERHVLAAWLPGSDTGELGRGAAFRWPAGEHLALHIHYKKTWKLEGKPAVDRSTVGVYLLKGAPTREVRSVLLPSTGAVLDSEVQPLAFRTDAGGSPDIPVRVDALLPTGERIPLIGLTTRAGWDQRYWLGRPRGLPKGTRLEVSAPGHSGPTPAPLWFEYAVHRS